MIKSGFCTAILNAVTKPSILAKKVERVIYCGILEPGQTATAKRYQIEFMKFIDVLQENDGSRKPEIDIAA